MMAALAPLSGAGDLRQSPLRAEHVTLGAKMVSFGGWEMPLSYPGGTVAEHLACRRSAVAFDVSHLGTVALQGGGAFDRLQAALTNDLRRIGPGRAQYNLLLDEVDASVTDDVIVWWVDQEHFEVMPNASNTDAVKGVLGGEDRTGERAMIAVQGPQARHRLESVAPDAAGVPRFSVRPFTWQEVECLAAGTGYTGEDGVECSVPADAAPAFWAEVLGAGVSPAGLGARDTLRLEAGLPLHGHELGPGITPLQAGLNWVVGWDKGQFRGRPALERERQAGPHRRLRGLVLDGRQPPRSSNQVLGSDGHRVGRVTSGNFSPCLERGIGLALLGPEVALGDQVGVEVRGRKLAGEVVGLPFVGHSS